MPNEVEITITAQDLSGPAFTGALAHLATLQAAAKMLAHDLGRISNVKLDTGAMAASLTALRSKIQQLGIADIADVNVPYGRLITQINIIKRFIDQAGISDLLDVNVDPQKLTSQIDKLKNISETIPVNFAVSPLPGNLIGKNLSETVTVTDTGIGQTDSNLKALGADLANIQKSSELWTTSFASGLNRIQGESSAAGIAIGGLAAAASAAVGASGGAGSGGGGGSGLLGAAAAGGYFGNVWGNVTSHLRTGGGGMGGWGFMIGGVAAWHLALDGAIEALISVGLATVAATAGAVTMAETSKDLAINLQSVDTVAGALGRTVPPLTGKLDDMAKAMAPQTIEVYGAGLSLVSQNSGLLLNAAKPVVTLFDDWAAKILMWDQRQKSFGGLLQSGTGYLSQFGHIIGTVGEAFGNLLHEDPGIAHYLLDIVGATASLLNDFTKLPGPIVAGVLAFHGLYIWGKVLAAGLIYLGTQAKNAAVSLYGLAKNPFVWVAAAAAAVAYMAYETGQADNSTKKWIASLDNGLANLSASQAIDQISTDIGLINSRMQATTVPAELQHWGLGFQSLGDDIRAVGDAWGSVLSSKGLSFFSNLGKALGDTFLYGKSEAAGAAIAVRNDINALDTELQKLVGQQNNLFHETGNLISQGYTYAQALALMDLAGVRAGDSFDLMRQKVRDLITGYQSLSIRGGILANSVNAVTFASLQQQEKVSQLNSGWDAFEQTVQGGAKNLYAFSAAINTLNGSLPKGANNLDTLGAKTTALGNNFVNAAAQANTEMDSLTLLANAAGLGQKGTDMLEQSTKDLIATMLPAASHSQTFTAILYALAQRGGYQGADSFKALSDWIGKTQNPMQNLAGIVRVLTKDSAGLTTDVRNLSMALGTTLNNAMATAIFQASGGQKVFNSFANAILTTRFNSQQDQTAAYNLASALEHLTGSASDTRNEFISFAEKALGLTKSQADILWQETFPKLQSTINALHGTNIPIHSTVSGSGDITMKQQLLGQNSSGYLAFHAAGGPVVGSGGPTQDNIPIMASAGEYVVNAKSAAAIGPVGMAAINSYAQGGPVVTDNIKDPWGVFGNWQAKQAETFGASALNSFDQKAVGGFKAAWKAALSKELAKGLGALPHGNIGSVYNEEKYAASLFPKYGWSGYQILPLGALWNRESGWNPYAVNPSSGAYGIPQALPAAWGHPYALGDAKAQIAWGEWYVNNRYGNPSNAWGHEVAFGWYKDGLDAVVNKPTLIGVGEAGSEHVSVTPAGRGRRQTVRLEFAGSQELQQLFAKTIRRIVIVDGGGDVQVALGQES